MIGQLSLKAVSLILAGIVAVGAVGIVGVVVLGGSDEQLAAMGEPMVNASEALADAEQRANDLIDRAVGAGEDVARDGEVSCWYSYPDSGGEPQGFVRCGPVAFADSAEDTYWLRVPVRFRRLGDRTLVVDEEETVGGRRTWTLPEDEELRRPDGRDAPSPDDIDLVRPSAPLAEPGRTGGIDPTALMVDLDQQPDDRGLRGAGYELTVERFTTTDRVRLEDGRGRDAGVLAAADGERWLVFQLSGEVSDPLMIDRLEYGIAVDGERQLLDTRRAPGSPGGTEATFAASVPGDADQIALVVGDGVAEQRWSFTTQERLGDAPAVLYRDPGTRVANIGEERSLPYGVNDPYTPSPFGATELSLTFGQARLDYAVEVAYLNGDSVLHTASGPDRALLYLVDVTADWGDILDSEYVLGPFDNVLSPEDAVLTLEDGTEVRPTLLPADVFNLGSLEGLDAEGFQPGAVPIDIFGGFLVWDVPADLEHATLRIQPGTRVTPTTLLEVYFQGGSMEIEIDFGS